MKYRVTFYCLTVGLANMFGKFMYLAQHVTIFHICGTCSGSSPPPPHSALQACSLLLHRDRLLWPLSSFRVDKSFRGNSTGLNQFRGIWQSLLEGFLPASVLLGSLASSTTCYHCTELTKRWSGLENGGRDSRPVFTQRPLLHLPSPESSQQVYELISRFPNFHYSFSFPVEHYPLSGAPSRTWQLT